MVDFGVLYFNTTAEALTVIEYVSANSQTATFQEDMVSYLNKTGPYTLNNNSRPPFVYSESTSVPASNTSDLNWANKRWTWVLSIATFDLINVMSDYNIFSPNIPNSIATYAASNIIQEIYDLLDTTEYLTTLFILSADGINGISSIVYFSTLQNADEFLNNLELQTPQGDDFKKTFDTALINFTFNHDYLLGNSYNFGQGFGSDQSIAEAFGATSNFKVRKYIECKTERISSTGLDRISIIKNNTDDLDDYTLSSIGTPIETPSKTALYVMYNTTLIPDNNKGLLYFDNYDLAKSVQNYLVNQTATITSTIINAAVAAYNNLKSSLYSSPSNYFYQADDYYITSQVGQYEFSLIGSLGSTTSSSTTVTFTPVDDTATYTGGSTQLATTDGTSLYFLVSQIQNINSYLYIESGPYVPYLVDLLKKPVTNSSNPNVRYSDLLTSLSVAANKYILRYTDNYSGQDSAGLELSSYRGYAILSSTLSGQTLIVTEVNPGNTQVFTAYGDTLSNFRNNTQNKFVICVSPTNAPTRYIVFIDTIANVTTFKSAYTDVFTDGYAQTKSQIETLLGTKGVLFEPTPGAGFSIVSTSGIFSNTLQKWALYNIVNSSTNYTVSVLQPTQWYPIVQTDPFYAANLYYMYIFVPLEQTTSLTFLSGPRSVLKLKYKISISIAQDTTALKDSIINLINPAIYIPNTAIIPVSDSQAFNTTKNTNYYFNLLDQNFTWDIVYLYQTGLTGNLEEYIIEYESEGSPPSYPKGENLAAVLASSVEKSFMTLLLQPQNQISCFIAGATVETDQGLVPIETIEPKKHTIDGKRIKALTKDISPRARVVTLVKNVISDNVPDKDTVCTVWHKIKYKDSFRIAGQIPGLRGTPYRGEILYNILMDEVETIKINNMLTLTLSADHPIAKEYSN